MKIPPRIAVPAALAAGCTGALLFFLWWQLASSLPGTLPPDTVLPQTASGETLTQGNPVPVDSRDQALLHLRQGDLFAVRGEWKDAEQEFDQAVKAGGGLPALRKLVLAKLQRRDMEGVRETIRQLKAAGARPEDTALIENIVLLRSGELVEARKRLTEAADSPHKHYGLALLSIIEGNHAEAQKELKLVMEGWEPVLRSNARTLQSAYDEFSLFPEGRDLHLITLLSRALAQVQECELALPLLAQVTREKDDYRDAWIVQGYCELTTERAQQALVSLERAYNLNPEKPEIQYFLARTHSALGQSDNAITFFEYALENGFEPKAEVRRLLAREALTKDDAALALTQYDELTKEQDATIESFDGYISTAMALDRKDEALAKAKEATVRFADTAHAWNLLGWVTSAMGQKAEARTALTRALSIDPFLASAKERLEKVK
ncbi:MAG: tetratricopeptide repeat protein [Candidatus Peribacteraceae bacterium]|nr:tetratricopeptide repeat protein [Candidatus Peribacteraceae bacterium]MDD5074284.1 tetratricopeptide repeat protein [Candidatus Peribacteraceae bacterium]